MTRSDRSPDRSRAPADPDTYLIDEVDVAMRIIDGKHTVESKSGSKGGKLKVADRDTDIRFVLEGTGSDVGAVTLSRPQLDRLRRILATVTSGTDESGPADSTATGSPP